METPVERIETTIGELIEAITQIALEAGNSKEEGYQLAQLTLGKILRDCGREIDSALL